MYIHYNFVKRIVQRLILELSGSSNLHEDHNNNNSYYYNIVICIRGYEVLYKGKSLYANHVIGVKINVPIMLYHLGEGVKS